MGCDVHFHVERRTDDGWKAVPVPDAFLDAQNVDLPHWAEMWRAHYVGGLDWDIHRSYRLFDALSGVRCSPHWHAVGGHAHWLCAEGLPGDMAPETEKDRIDWEGDAHSDGHGSLRQLMDERIAHAGGPQWSLLLTHMTPLAEGDLDSVRGVWWFDN